MMVTGLRGQQLLTPYLESTAFKNPISSDSRRIVRLNSSCLRLSTQEATEQLMTVLQTLPKGYEFTCNELFSGVRLLGDKRARGAVLNALRRSGLITVIGYTTDNQEGRHNGYAAKWTVV